MNNCCSLATVRKLSLFSILFCRYYGIWSRRLHQKSLQGLPRRDLCLWQRHRTCKTTHKNKNAQRKAFQEALSIASDVVLTLRATSRPSRPLFSNELTLLKEHALPDGILHKIGPFPGANYFFRHYQKTHNTTCLFSVYQIGVQSPRENMLLDLLVQILREPAFNTLRTNEQLGGLFRN